MRFVVPLRSPPLALHTSRASLLLLPIELRTFLNFPRFDDRNSESPWYDLCYPVSDSFRPRLAMSNIQTFFCLADLAQGRESASLSGRFTSTVSPRRLLLQVRLFFRPFYTASFAIRIKILFSLSMSFPSLSQFRRFDDWSPSRGRSVSFPPLRTGPSFIHFFNE